MADYEKSPRTQSPYPIHIVKNKNGRVQIKSDEDDAEPRMYPELFPVQKQSYSPNPMIAEIASRSGIPQDVGNRGQPIQRDTQDKKTRWISQEEVAEAQYTNSNDGVRHNPQVITYLPKSSVGSDHHAGLLQRVAEFSDILGDENLIAVTLYQNACMQTYGGKWSETNQRMQKGEIMTGYSALVSERTPTSSFTSYLPPLYQKVSVYNFGAIEDEVVSLLENGALRDVVDPRPARGTGDPDQIALNPQQSNDLVSMYQARSRLGKEQQFWYPSLGVFNSSASLSQDQTTGDYYLILVGGHESVHHRLIREMSDGQLPIRLLAEKTHKLKRENGDKGDITAVKYLQTLNHAFIAARFHDFLRTRKINVAPVQGFSMPSISPVYSQFYNTIEEGPPQTNGFLLNIEVAKLHSDHKDGTRNEGMGTIFIMESPRLFAKIDLDDEHMKDLKYFPISTGIMNHSTTVDSNPRQGLYVAGINRVTNIATLKHRPFNAVFQGSLGPLLPPDLGWASVKKSTHLHSLSCVISGMDFRYVDLDDFRVYTRDLHDDERVNAHRFSPVIKTIIDAIPYTCAILQGDLAFRVFGDYSVAVDEGEIALLESEDDTKVERSGSNAIDEDGDSVPRLETPIINWFLKLEYHEEHFFSFTIGTFRFAEEMLEARYNSEVMLKKN